MLKRLPLVSLVAVAAVVSFGCSSEPTGTVQHGPGPGGTNNPPGNTNPPINDTTPPTTPPTNPPPGTVISGDVTWADGETLAGDTTIAAGTTVTIAPGAKVTIAKGASITVLGTLKSATNATHGSITTATPTDGWGGLVIGSGGTLNLDSIDLVAPAVALSTKAGNTAAAYLNGVISAGAATQPFQMEAGSTLSITKSKATAAAQSALAGTFTASYLNYDKGSNEGLNINDANAVITITDSTLGGSGGGDYVVVTVAKTLSVSYTTIAGSHCPFHFSTGPSTYTVDHVSDNTNAYGWMLYGSGTGPNTISNSNFRDMTQNIEMTGTNGKVTLTNNYFGASPSTLTQGVATTVSTSKTAIANAQPR
jgi:hypothetical protein